MITLKDAALFLLLHTASLLVGALIGGKVFFLWLEGKINFKRKASPPDRT